MSKRRDVGIWLRLTAASAALLACAGCASTAYLDLDSDPPGAVIRTQDGVRVGTAPISVRLGAIPVSAYEGHNGWAPGKTYVASKDGYEPAYWSPQLSLAKATRAIGLPHTWNHVFVLSPKPPEPASVNSPKAAEPARPQAPRQGEPAVVAASSAGSGTILLTAEPDNADIVVDGRFFGNSPATLRLPEGTHVVEVRNNGLRPYRKEIHVTDKSEQTLRVRLAP